MAPKKWRGQTATLEAEGNDLPSEPFGVIDEPEISAPEQEVQEGRGAGDTRWFDLQKTETAVSLSGTILTWDPEAWDRLIDYDDSAGEMDHSADVATFTVTVTFESADGSMKEIPINECYVDGSVPIGGSREEWVSMDLSMRGRGIGEIVNTDASA